VDIFDKPQVLNRISIDKLSDKELIIKYETENELKKKKYSF
jgi:hypothetical protein